MERTTLILWFRSIVAAVLVYMLAAKQEASMDIKAEIE